MKRRSMNNGMNELMRQNIIKELKALNVSETVEGIALHQATYQELKWHYAFELAKREI